MFKMFIYCLYDFYVQPEKPSILDLQMFFNWVVQPTVGQNDTQIKSKRDSHQSCFWCEALLANLRNAQKDGTVLDSSIFFVEVTGFIDSFVQEPYEMTQVFNPINTRRFVSPGRSRAMQKAVDLFEFLGIKKSEEKTLIVHSTTSWIIETSTLDLPVSVGTWLAGCDSEVFLL